MYKKVPYITDQNHPAIKEYVEAMKKGTPQRKIDPRVVSTIASVVIILIGTLIAIKLGGGSPCR